MKKFFINLLGCCIPFPAFRRYVKCKLFYCMFVNKSQPQFSDGISIIEIGDFSGEGKTGKSAIASLQKSNINFDCCSFNELYVKYKPKYKTQLAFSTCDFIKNPAYDVIPLLVWEFESGMEYARPYAFNGISGVATFSNFCAEYFRKIAPKHINVTVLPYPVDIDLDNLEPKQQVREKYGIKFCDFVFFFNFSYSSSYFRKNPEGVLAAFVQAFPRRDKNIKLVIKTVQSGFAPQMVARLKNKILDFELEDNVILIDENLTDMEQYSLINACDAYISMHRGEGLGLGIIEAMAMGKPVIATNYGGNTDFTKRDTALLVDYEMVTPAEIDLEEYKCVKKWPEPNIKTAAKHMRYLYGHQDEGQKLGMRAQKFIRENFNSNEFNRALKGMLHKNN